MGLRPTQSLKWNLTTSARWLHETEARCECGADLDSLGRDRAACPRSGRLSTRALGPEKDTGQDLPGGGSHCAMQCQAEGHGHRNVCTGREGNRSSRIGAPTAPRSAACGRRHNPVRPDSEQRSSPQRCSGERRSLLSSLLEGGGIRNRRKVERRSHSVYRRSCGGPIKGSTTVMRRPAFLAWKKRWSRMIGISCGRAFANSLAAVANATHTLAGVDGKMPDLADLLGEG